MKEVLVVKDLKCIKAITHPKRIDILNSFSGLPLSAKQLSHILDEPHAKINYHIKALRNIGILELVEEKVKSGIIEKYYYPKAKYIVVKSNVLTFSIEGDNTEKYDEQVKIFEDISDSFYEATQRNEISSENIVDDKEISLSKNQLEELLFIIKSKLNEIEVEEKDNPDEENRYNLSIINIPIKRKTSKNI